MYRVELVISRSVKMMMIVVLIAIVMISVMDAVMTAVIADDGGLVMLNL